MASDGGTMPSSFASLVSSGGLASRLTARCLTFLPALSHKSRLEQGRKRQGLVPDFRVRVPARGQGPQVDELVLAVLKSISSCPTRYKRNPRATTKAVDRRASTLPSEYTQHAKMLDRVYGGTPDGAVGPVQAKLQSFPPLRRWVFGAWGEASEDVHTLVHDLATSRAKHQRQLEGRWRWSRRSEEGE